jgi:hypothetical protein
MLVPDSIGALGVIFRAFRDTWKFLVVAGGFKRS